MKLTSSIFTFIITTSIIAICFSSCGEHSHELSEERKEAISMFETSERLAKEFHSKLAAKFAQTDPNDANFALLVSLDSRYKVWSETLAPIPGVACNHEEGEEHKHDHAAEAALEGLSDKELLELQKAIQSELMNIFTDFDAIK